MVFYVVTVRQGTTSQPGYALATRTLCRDSVALRCVVTKKAMSARQTRPGAHDKAGAPRLCAYDRDILLQQTSYNGQKRKKKKKKDPLGLGRHRQSSINSFIQKHFTVSDKLL